MKSLNRAVRQFDNLIESVEPDVSFFQDRAEAFEDKMILQGLSEYGYFDGDAWENGSLEEAAGASVKPVPMRDIEWKPKLRSKRFMDSSHIKAEFKLKVPGGEEVRIVVDLSGSTYQASGGRWNLTFQQFSSEHRSGTYGATGNVGSDLSGKIFATVVMIVNTFVKYRNPDNINFSSSGHSRTKLYRALARQFAGDSFKVAADLGHPSNWSGQSIRTVVPEGPAWNPVTGKFDGPISPRRVETRTTSPRPSHGSFNINRREQSQTEKPLLSISELEDDAGVILLRKKNNSTKLYSVLVYKQKRRRGQPDLETTHTAKYKELAASTQLYNRVRDMQRGRRDAEAALLQNAIRINNPGITKSDLKERSKALFKNWPQAEEEKRAAKERDPQRYNKALNMALKKPMFHYDFIKLAKKKWAVNYLLDNPGDKPPVLIHANIERILREVGRALKGQG